MAPVLVLAAHPDLRMSRVNRALLEAARALAGSADGALDVRDLYAFYPDYVIDVPAEQAACERAQLIVWQHPIHWYSMPALMKLWVDEVLTLGWAYGEGGRHLRGKDLWLVASTGGAADTYRPEGYNRHLFDAFLPPYEQTAALCGMRFLPPMILHGAHGADAARIAAHVAAYREQLLGYPNWPEMDGLDACPSCEMPAADRPGGPVPEGLAGSEVAA